jgi:histidinol-phosphatase (PHP family)
MTIPHDYHLHTLASCDSDATMRAMCHRALQCGLTEIAFTDHFDSKPEDDCAGFYDPDAYFAALDAARQTFVAQGLTIRAGVEVGEHHLFHAEQQPVLDAWPYDVVLGSLHWVGDAIVFDAAMFEHAPPEATIPAYFEELARMARHGGFDVLAHPDVIKRTAYEVYGHFDITAWEDWVRPVWHACIDNGIAVEINTSGLRRAVNELHPAEAALRWYRAMGGELLTLGSDGHRPAHVGAGLDVARDLVQAVGFTRVCRFEGRQVSWVPI